MLSMSFSKCWVKQSAITYRSIPAWQLATWLLCAFRWGLKCSVTPYTAGTQPCDASASVQGACPSLPRTDSQDTGQGCLLTWDLDGHLSSGAGKMPWRWPFTHWPEKADMVSELSSEIETYKVICISVFCCALSLEDKERRNLHYWDLSPLGLCSELTSRSHYWSWPQTTIQGLAFVK